MVEKMIFNLFAFTLFILMFLSFVRKNDTNYVYFLVLQFIGIAINFVELIVGRNFSLIVKVIMYLLSVILPLMILIFEYIKKISISEIINIWKASIYIKAGNLEEAKKILRGIAEKNRKSYKAIKMLANIYEKQNKYELALEEYEKVKEENPQNNELDLKIGTLYEKIGRTSEAVNIISEILKKTPNYYEASIALGDIYYQNGAFKEATQVYTAALKYKPADYELYYYLGMSYTMLNDFKNAKENYDKAAQINSELYHAKYSIGQLNLIYGELAEAEECFLQCIDVEDMEAEAYYYLARISMIKGDITKATYYSNIAIEEKPEIFDKITKENIFAPILDLVNKPEKSNNKVKKSKLTKRELDIDEHLDNTCNLVGKLNNNDIKMIENLKRSRIEQERDTNNYEITQNERTKNE